MFGNTRTRRMISSQLLPLALVICKSKPDGLSIRDYILELRKYTKSNPSIENKSRFDAAGYWKDRCKSCELEMSMIKVRLGDEKRKSNQLNSRLDLAPEQSIKKRGKNANEDEIAAKRSKRTDKVQRPSAHKTHEWSDENAEIIRIDEHGEIAAMCFYRLHNLFHQEAIDCSSLSSALEEAAKQLSVKVFEYCHQVLIDDGLSTTEGNRLQTPTAKTSASITARRNNIDDQFHAIARLFMTLLYGTSRLATGENGKKYLGSAVYACVTCFRNILSCLRETVAEVAAVELATGKNSEPSNAKSKTKATKIRCDQRLCHSISMILNSVLLHLNVGDPAHKELFEGFTFATLERAAQVIQMVTFGHERGPSIEKDIALTGLHDGGPTDAGLNRALDKRALELEAPYLMPLFERCCSLASLHLNQPSNPRPSRAKSVKPGKVISRIPAYSGKLVLNTRIRERLQQTLINCIFGEGEKKQDDFMDCLRMPSKLVSPPAPKNFKQDADVGTWFVAEAWRILGWEILSKEME